MSLISNNWILIWCGLEIILICFIPIILNKNFNSSECCLKYFIIQRVRSSILILSIILILININFNIGIILNISLIIKIGVAPFHIWVLNVVEGLDFNFLFVLLTLIKLPPLCILSYVSLYLIPFIFLTLILGSILGLNQRSSRKIIGYSSIFNIGFILSCVFFNHIWLFYLFFYSVIIYLLIYILINLNLNYINQFIVNDFNPFSKFILFLRLLSIGGIPPLIGFIIKLIVLELMLFINFYLVRFIIIVFSLLIIFIYIRITFLSIIIYGYISKLTLNLNIYNFIWILLLNITILILIINVKLFI